MMKKLLSLALAVVMVAALVPAVMPGIVPTALGASFVLPVTGGVAEGSRNTWTVGNTPGLTSAMLQTANRLVVQINGNNGGRGLSLYAQGPGTGWWDDTEICELSSGTMTFQLEWKRVAFQPTQTMSNAPADGLNLGCAWWTNSWSTVRSSISSITLIYGEPLVFPTLNEIGTPLSAPSNPNAGRISGQGFINAADVTMLRRYIAQGNDATGLVGFNLANADVNGDGVIDANDVTLLRRHVAATNPSTVPLGPMDGYVPLDKRPIQTNAQWYTAITIDDGPIWGPSTTGSTMTQLDALASSKSPCGVSARATWFVQGRRITGQVEPLVKRMVSLGHDIENHTWGHGNVTPVPCAQRRSWVDNVLVSDPCSCGNIRHWVSDADQGVSNVSGFTAQMFRREIDASSDKIEDVTGRRPIYFRFPQFSGGSHAAAVNSAGMRVIHAQVDSRDTTVSWNQARGIQELRNGGQIDGTTYGNVNSGGWDGVIWLYHDAGGDGSHHMYTQQVANVFRAVVPDLQAIGYSFVTVEELVTIKGATPAMGGGGAQFNGHFGTRRW
jgi:peptidoglycan/xylan/chitin deacetylase (PgdA/CDA1 family)